MGGEPLPPYCNNCVVPLTINHLLVECPDYVDIRHLLYGINCDLRTMLAEPINGQFDLNTLITLLTNLGIMNDI